MSAKSRKRSKVWFWILLGILGLLLVVILLGGFAAMRFYGNIKPMLVVEAGEAIPEADEFQVEKWDLISMDTDITGLNPDQPGVYSVDFSLGPMTKQSILTIRDSVPPVGESRDLTIKVGEELDPEDFIVSMEDETEISVIFINGPDVYSEGKQTIRIALEDQGGNRTTLTSELTVYDPEKGPEIRGVRDIEIIEGENIAYRDGVTVYDALDPAPVLNIDNTKVDPDVPGNYRVVYRATDCYDRVTEVAARVLVQKKPDNYDDMMLVEELSKTMARQLTTGDMTEIEKIFNIFRWVRLNIPWDNTRTSRDEVEQTLKGLKGESGDCYTHAITCKKLLDQAGFETILMHRDPGPGQHYWILIHTEQGWFHLDPSPIYMSVNICFLQTDEQVRTFSEWSRRNYYGFNHLNYPYTPMQSPAKVKYRRGDYILEMVE